MPIPTQLPPLDRALGGGLPDVGLVLIGALIDSGQQILATHMAMRCAKQSGRATHHWLWRHGGYDDGRNKPDARARLIAARSGLPLRKVLRYQLDADQLDLLKATVLEIDGLPLELHTHCWSSGPPQPEHIEAAIAPGTIHVIERIDDLIHEPASKQVRQIGEHLARVAHQQQALIIAVANSVWPQGEDYALEPAPLVAWGPLRAVADVTLLAGPIRPKQRDGLRLRVVRGGEEEEVWCPVDVASGAVLGSDRG
jgi:hypothetical protein